MRHVRLLVLNADDLGLSAEADEGIAVAAAAGLVTEASLLVTTAGAEEGAATGLGTGLHLCLTEGRSLTGRIRGLTDRGGRFLPLPVAFASCLARVPDAGAVRKEVRAQLARARALLPSVGHLNGHHHVHLFPVVRGAVVEVAREEGIRHVRVPGPSAAAPGLRGPVVARLGASFRRTARGSGLRTLPLRGFRARDPEGSLAEARTPATEILLHPRKGNAEARALADAGLRRRLEDLGLRPARYAETEAFSGIL